jgi:hypothetical protein
MIILWKMITVMTWWFVWCRIPLSFILGFYVSQVVSRWWDQWGVIAWPDRKVTIQPWKKELLECLLVCNLPAIYATWLLPEHSYSPARYRSRIHERTISLRFQGIILRVLRPEVSGYNVYITNQFQNHFYSRRGGVESISSSDCE